VVGQGLSGKKVINPLHPLGLDGRHRLQERRGGVGEKAGRKSSCTKGMVHGHAPTCIRVANTIPLIGKNRGYDKLLRKEFSPFMAGTKHYMSEGAGDPRIAVRSPRLRRAQANPESSCSTRRSRAPDDQSSGWQHKRPVQQPQHPQVLLQPIPHVQKRDGSGKGTGSGPSRPALVGVGAEAPAQNFRKGKCRWSAFGARRRNENLLAVLPLRGGA